MNINNALELFGLSGTITKQDVKLAYRKACSTYHPDRNPAGLQMMQAINEAYEALKDYEGNTEANNDEAYCETLSTALNAVIDLDGLTIEICGNWIWLTGETKTHKEAIKKAGFKWASKKKSWNFRPAKWKSASRGSMSMEDIRETHGSQSVQRKQKKAIAA